MSKGKRLLKELMHWLQCWPWYPTTCPTGFYADVTGVLSDHPVTEYWGDLIKDEDELVLVRVDQRSHLYLPRWYRNGPATAWNEREEPGYWFAWNSAKGWFHLDGEEACVRLYEEARKFPKDSGNEVALRGMSIPTGDALLDSLPLALYKRCQADVEDRKRFYTLYRKVVCWLINTARPNDRLVLTLFEAAEDVEDKAVAYFHNGEISGRFQVEDGEGILPFVLFLGDSVFTT